MSKAPQVSHVVMW